MPALPDARCSTTDTVTRFSSRENGGALHAAAVTQQSAVELPAAKTTALRKTRASDASRRDPPHQSKTNMAECAARFRSRANADSIGALLHPGTENERQAALRRKGRPARDHARENVLAIRRAERENRQRKEEAANAVRKPYKMKQFRNVRMRRP